MKILHLATFLQGGAGRVLVDLVADQRRAGHDVSVMASRTSAPEAGYGNNPAYLDELARREVPVRLVDSMFVREHAANLAVVRAAADWCPPGLEPDVVHTHAAIPSLVALLFAGARHRPMAVVQTMHGWGGAKTPGQVVTDIELMNLVDRVAVPSRYSADVIASLGVARTRIAVVAHGVGADATDLDLGDRGALRDMERARQSGLLVVACVGTIGARKNQRVLVDAIARMTGPRAAFVVFIGDGDARDLNHVIALAGLGGRVRVHGYSRAARRLAAGADVLVLPSRSEGQPLAVLEAFCDGTLVVVSSIPELAELVADGATGLQFSADDAASLAAALDRIAIMPEAARRAITGRARLVQASRFSTSVMANHYTELYRESYDAQAPGQTPGRWSRRPPEVPVMLDTDLQTPRRTAAPGTTSTDDRGRREAAMDASEHRVFALAVAPWLTPVTRAVEIGPGVGRWTVWMAPLVGELVVVDAADAILERTRARMRTAGVTNVSFVLGTGLNLSPLPSDGYDLVFGRDVVVRLPLEEAAACLSEIARVLRDGGVSVLHHAVNDVRPVCHDALVRLYGRFGLHIDSVWTDRSTTVVTARKPADSIVPRLEQALRSAASAGDERALEDAARDISDLARGLADRVTTLTAALSATAPGPERQEVIQQIRRLVRG